MGKRISFDVIVIGGGAAGFFAAINLKELQPHLKVLILEKSQQLLSKVKISGGGRCNVTHACFEHKELTTNYPRGEKELLGPFYSFYTGDTIEWFSRKGIELVIEDDGRMFPKTNTSSTIVNCFLESARTLGIEVMTQSEVINIQKNEFFSVELKGGQKLSSKHLIMATGGHPKMKHFDMIQNLGHEIIPPIPSLFTFNLKAKTTAELMGLSSNANVIINGTHYEEYGPVLFTHWGFSGPAILKLSSKAARFLHEKNYQFDFSVCWLTESQDLIDHHRHKNGSKQVISTKIKDIPKRLWHYLVRRAGLNIHLNWADLNKAQIETLGATLESDVYTANGKTTFKEEFVTCGGVNLKDINMKTMESKKVPGLYLCGEVINVDALTGGFNFQAAWTTAWLAAQHIHSVEAFEIKS